MFLHRQLAVSHYDYDCILAMLLRLSRNGRLEVTQFSVPTISRAVSVIWRAALCNTTVLPATGSLNTCPIHKEQLWIFNVFKTLLGYTGPPKFRSRSERSSNSRVKSLLKTCCPFGAARTRSAKNMIDSLSLYQLRHSDIDMTKNI